jgi:CDGSH-type Zn-finger protein/truncated hemoglobin YjbI
MADDRDRDRERRAGAEITPDSLLRSALALEAAMLTGSLSGREDERSHLDVAVERLKRSVIRPLRDAQADRVAASDTARTHGDTVVPQSDTAVPQSDRAVAESDTLGEWLEQLARQATTLRLSPGVPTEVQEATAALQDLACRFAANRSELVAELRAIQSGLPVAIQSQADGPYLVTNAEHMVDWLGRPLTVMPQMALCRCGGSQLKPFCDGTHAEIGFTSEKDPARVPDHRDSYAGQQVTVLDNRGICQHSGYCSDRLATVFRVGQEPFVAPSGGRMDEVIRAVRDCPSGALSYAVDGVEARDEVDYHGTRAPQIEISKDGPYRVTGGIPLADDDRNDEVRSGGSSREHYALCRCGHSQNKPFCSGMHWYVDFKDPVADPEHGPTIFEWAGGYPALLRMTRIFYEKYVPQDPLLAPLFASMSPDHPQRVAAWLGEVFGGPAVYSEQYRGYTRMVSQHIGKGLTEEKRSRWVQLILASAQDAGLPADPEFRSAFSSYIEWGSRLALENSQPGAKPPEHMPMPHWDWNTAAGPPGSRISALEPTAEEDRPAILPRPDEPVSFEKHVATLFRHRDRQSMKFAFDLWSYDDVKVNAHAILERVRNGSMPCDGAWPPEYAGAFARWVATGMRP